MREAGKLCVSRRDRRRNDYRRGDKKSSRREIDRLMIMEAADWLAYKQDNIK